jgi:hypothetical protein
MRSAAVGKEDGVPNPLQRTRRRVPVLGREVGVAPDGAPKNRRDGAIAFARVFTVH